MASVFRLVTNLAKGEWGLTFWKVLTLWGRFDLAMANSKIWRCISAQALFFNMGFGDKPANSRREFLSRMILSNKGSYPSSLGAFRKFSLG